MFNKVEWQRNKRREFAAKNGFSSRCNYGGVRLQVLERDGFKCVKCGMTDDQHKATWQRPITVDHKDKNRKNNTMENLQTLCLKCHGKKDLIPRLRARRVEAKKDQILQMHREGKTCTVIAEATGFSLTAVWKWLQVWNRETAS